MTPPLRERLERVYDEQHTRPAIDAAARRRLVIDDLLTLVLEAVDEKHDDLKDEISKLEEEIEIWKAGKKK